MCRASKKLKNIVYGNHSYAKNQIGDSESISSITKSDLQNFVKNNFTKSNLVLSLVGDIDGLNIKSKLSKTLSSLADKQTNIIDIKKPELNLVSKVHNIEYDIPQSIILFSMPGILRDDEEFYSTYLMNYILGGGGFESRLLEEVRKKQGLVYSISTYLDVSNKAGTTSGYAATANENVTKAIDLIKKELIKFKEDGITDTELQDAKDYLVNSLPLKLTKNSNLAGFLNSIQVNDLGIDFFEKRNSMIGNVSKEKINNQAKKLINLDKLVFVVVGK